MSREPDRGKIAEVLLALQDHLERRLPSLAGKVDIFPGVFDDDAVKQFASGAGRLKLAFLGASNFDATPSNEQMLNAAFGVYTATAGNLDERTLRGIDRLEAVAVLVASLGLIEGDGWDITMTMPPVIGAIENLYSKDTAGRGVSLLGLSFAFPILIGESSFARDLERLDGLIAASLQEDGVTIALDPTDEERIEPPDAVA